VIDDEPYDSCSRMCSKQCFDEIHNYGVQTAAAIRHITLFVRLLFFFRKNVFEEFRLTFF